MNTVFNVLSSKRDTFPLRIQTHRIYNNDEWLMINLIKIIWNYAKENIDENEIIVIRLLY